MTNQKQKKVAVIVAHPDDETLWAGGTLLNHPYWDCFIISLCRAKDKDRAPKFDEALKLLNARGIMGNLDDGPSQKPLAENVVEQLILKLLPNEHFDLIITHHPLGEYTKHLRHEEVSKALINIWNNGKISADNLWVFAYEDGGKAYLPRPVEKADLLIKLSHDLWLKKYAIITKTYGFNPESWEAETTPKTEAFWQFTDAKKAKKWMENIRIPNKETIKKT
jgi:LmbE family N-acetylglucosaminyl deacetylase